MADRLLYDLQEVKNAAAYLHEKTELLRSAHAGNWRARFGGFMDEMMQRFEALKLLTTLLGGNGNVDTDKWFAATMAGSPPPLPDKPYDAMALVFQQIAAAVKKQGEGFFVGDAAVDLPYVLTCGFEGGSLGEKFHWWSEAFVRPFAARLDAWADAIVAGLPASGNVDLWDLALEVVDQAIPAEEDAAGAGEREAATQARNKAKAKAKAPKKAAGSASAKAKAKPSASQKGTKKGRPVTSAKNGSKAAGGAASKKSSKAKKANKAKA